MRMKSLRLNAYRRFSDVHIDMRDPVIALVGPNEAGKTSILTALQTLNRQEELSQKDIKRGHKLEDKTDPVIEAEFELDGEDADAIADLQGADTCGRFFVARQANGGLRGKVENAPARNKVPRARAAQALMDFDWKPLEGTFTGSNSEKQNSIKKLRSRVSAAGTALQSSSGTLMPEELKAIAEIQDSLHTLPEAGTPAAVQSEHLHKLLEEVLSFEREEHPDRQLVNALLDRVPRFLAFTAEDRDLKEEYSAGDLKNPHPALRNLLTAGNISPRSLLTAIQRSDRSLIETMETKANARLSQVFASWTQFPVSPRIRIDTAESDGAITIHTDAAGRFVGLNERSDGLRAFVALVAFVSTHSSSGSTPPVLLVDEAERHLHYSAQSDLVHAFQEQCAAAQVIYTTHSAGCLPDDLGTTVRVLLRDEEHHSSRVENCFWVLGSGFTPLLTAMGIGVSALAFTPARYAVIAEGGSDLILLPSLLREAAGVRSLGFQIAPGLAEIGGAALAELDVEASKVAFLVDADDAGNLKREDLIRAGYSEHQIVRLAEGESNLTVEDLVHTDTFCTAVNSVLQTMGANVNMKASEVPPIGRAKWLKQWSTEQGLSVPSHREIAREVANRRSELTLVADDRTDLVAALYGKLQDALKLPRDVQVDRAR